MNMLISIAVSKWHVEHATEKEWRCFQKDDKPFSQPNLVEEALPAPHGMAMRSGWPRHFLGEECVQIIVSVFV